MEAFSETNTLPISIAQIDVSLYAEQEPAPAPANAMAPDGHEQLLVALVTRTGELEAAEWVLDQAKAAFDTQIAAALSAGVPAEAVAEAAGVPVDSLARFGVGRGQGSPEN
jgi:hypothetical protein